MICRICKQDKNEESFYFRKDSGKRRTECVMCRSLIDKKSLAKKLYNKRKWATNKKQASERYKNWYRENHGKQIQRSMKYHLKKNYGLTLSEYKNLFDKQGGKCAICGNGEVIKRNNKIKNLAVDHDHTTGKIRGLLCQNCNRGIGLLKENIETLLNAVRYINEHKND